jgi:ABC-type sugar transport system permease subunit
MPDQRFQPQARTAPWMFLAPFAVVFLTFTVYPLMDSVRLSLRQTVGMSVDVYVAARNFAELLHDETFWNSLGRTAYFAGMSLLVQLPAALGLALLVHRKRLWGRSFFRTAFFLPVLIGAAFIGVGFKLIYGLQDGALNACLGWVGIPAVDWLRDPDVVMNTLVLTGVWMFAGFNMVYFLAGLQGIPTELYDAATVDGANRWQQFWAVTMPGLWPIAAFLMTASMIGSFGLFDLPWVLMEHGGPGRASTTVVVYLYERGFLVGNLGYAAAMGWAVTFLLLVAALVQLRISRAWGD